MSFNGSVVGGSAYNANANYRATRWVNGVIQPLAGPISFARGVSGDGQVTVGGQGNYFGSGDEHACKWIGGGATIPLEELENTTSSNALDSNYDGSVILGTSGIHGVRWTATGVSPLELLPGGTYAAGLAMNTNGNVIAGFGSGMFAGEHLIRWVGDSEPEDLGVLAESEYVVPTGVSADGQAIVGLAGVNTEDGVVETQFLWTPGTGMVDLADYFALSGVDLTGWQLDEASGISDDGTVIAGWGSYLGQERGWIVTGVPAPGALPALAIGALIAWGRRRA